MLRVALSFDYDSPAGYRESFHLRNMPANADYEGADILMRVLRKHNVIVTFGVVGEAALPGEPPHHCQEQIQAIRRAGHEIASHSMTHRFIPPMRDPELLEEVAASKHALETCIGAEIEGFIPPFNRPCHFPQAGAFSIAESLGLDGRGRGRQSVGTMLRTLKTAGFSWSRVSFQNKLLQMGLRLRLTSDRSPMQPFLYHGMVAIPLHQTGFGDAARKLVRKWLDTDLIVTLYGHPNQAFAANDQSAEALDTFFSEFRSEHEKGRLAFCTMGDAARLSRTDNIEPRTTVLA